MKKSIMKLIIAVILVVFTLLMNPEPAHPAEKKKSSYSAKEYQELLDKYEAVKQDRDNVLIQTKRLLEEKRSTQELEDSVKKLEEEKALIKTEKEAALAENQKLKEELTGVSDKLKETDAAKVSAEEELNKAKSGIIVKELKQKITGLQKENKEKDSASKKELAELSKRLKEKEDEIARLNNDVVKKAQEKIGSLMEEKAKSEKKIEELSKKLGETEKKYEETAKQNKSIEDKFGNLQKEADKLKKDKEEAETKIKDQKELIAKQEKGYSEAVKKNKALAQEAKNVPKKFSEIARQNKKLIKDMSKLHYNTGVFYTKHQEYRQAVAEYEKAIEIDPDDADAHFNLGYIYAEYLVDRHKAVEHFRHFLRLAGGEDEDIDWVRKYILTWETFEGKQVLR